MGGATTEVFRCSPRIRQLRYGKRVWHGISKRFCVGASGESVAISSDLREEMNTWKAGRNDSQTVSSA
jgi:hypothetical protein